eukprot:TRINITY_DN2593_c0_g2_i2.p1 TRINITY_DN2593_c0_g2~~TRINITY_DN2593_c0_g2_i2.p1  ORF type:complete len:550 (+),score=231.89 TRINITY_DN2593_c0_g2_i2:109-1758(+)
MVKETIFLDGESLTPDILVELATGKYHIDLTEEAWKKVAEGRTVVDEILRRGEVVYGINTGFGNFATVVIPPEKLSQLQVNLIISHSSGVGTPIPRHRTRMLLALRTNVLAKGHSGIRVETLKKILAAFNNDCLSVVPEKGTVGASGDLAPLSHLALGLIGQGNMWNPDGEGELPASEVLASKGLTPIDLQAKEGLAMINGTQFISSLGCEALVRAKRIAKQADVIAALCVEALKGTHRAFHPAVHKVRPHKGQNAVARRIRSLLHGPETPSTIYESHIGCDRVQDSYTLRCTPQVHGVVHDTLAFVEDLLTVELNSATDNPMVFTGEDSERARLQKWSSGSPEDVERRCMDEAEVPQGMIISGGNFHGEYPAKALDYLGAAIHEIAQISERRIERLVNPALSDLPAFLVQEGGLCSGFMIAHCAAASLVSENKVLVHPASCDSISTSAAKEDHVSMGGFAARKALQIVEHVEQVVAIEYLCAAQGIEFLRPLETTAPLEKVHSLLRTVVKPYDTDRFMSPDINAAHELLKQNKVWECVEERINSFKDL